jgi:hypothetical protein
LNLGLDWRDQYAAPERTPKMGWSDRAVERVMSDHLTKAVRDLMRTFAHPLDPYRPELYYMRGPGPKCQAKRAGGAAPTAPALSESVAVLGELAEAHA